MSLATVKIGDVEISRMIIGGNPFSGFSHQGTERDAEMKHWYTVARIKEALRRNERLGITAHLSRADHHVMRYLLEYWDEGGSMRWLAQTCPGVGDTERGVANAIKGGAAAVHIHGGEMDFRLANGQLDDLPGHVEQARQAGLAVGIAGHDPRVFEWAEANLELDYYLCSYYNPIPRLERPEHRSGTDEKWSPDDRQWMAEVIQGLDRPVIHYKVLAAGNRNVSEAMEFVAQTLRPQDAVCIGIHTKDHPDGLAECVQLLDAALVRAGKEPLTAA